MEIIAAGILSQSVPGTNRACMTFPTITCLSGGELLASARVGDNKDSDHELIELYRSRDNGKTWSDPWTPFEAVSLGGQAGTLKLCYFTELSPGHVLGAAMWVDRASYPGKPLFNEKTEGCLPMAILLASSFDQGQTFSDWRRVDMPENLGPPSLTNPILKLVDGTLAMSIETNKHYEDASKWMQKAVFLFSRDNGLTWSDPTVVAQDPEALIFNWDLRCGVGADGRVASFAWTYDTQTQKYINIHRRISSDSAKTWSVPEDIGFADQAGPPAMLGDGRVVMAFVDRFDSQAIRVRTASAIDAPFEQHSEVIIYTHGDKGQKASGTGELLAGMEQWSFGLPFAQSLPDGNVLVTYYAGNSDEMSLYWTRLAV